jgi:hypothetical protein
MAIRIQCLCIDTADPARIASDGTDVGAANNGDQAITGFPA